MVAEIKNVLIISLDVGNDISDDKLFKITYDLQKILKNQGISDVRRPKNQELPKGAKGGGLDMNLINTLIIPLFASGGLITTIIAVLREWTLRKEGRTVKFKAQKGDSSFEFEYNPTITTNDELIVLAEKLAKLMDDHPGHPTIHRP